MSGDQADGLWRRVLLTSGLFVILAAAGHRVDQGTRRTHQFLPRHGHKTHAACQGSAAQPH